MGRGTKTSVPIKLNSPFENRGDSYNHVRNSGCIKKAWKFWWKFLQKNYGYSVNLFSWCCSCWRSIVSMLILYYFWTGVPIIQWYVFMKYRIPLYFDCIESKSLYWRITFSKNALIRDVMVNIIKLLKKYIHIKK